MIGPVFDDQNGSRVGALFQIDDVQVRAMDVRFAQVPVMCGHYLNDAIADKLELLTFLDLDWDIVNRVLEREKKQRRSGPIAENILRDLGPSAAGA